MPPQISRKARTFNREIAGILAADYADYADSEGKFRCSRLAVDLDCRLTVPPMLWMGFQGVGDATAMLLNVANMPHDPDEVDRKPRR